MKRKPILFLIALVALLGAILPRQAKADVSFSYFYDNLSPYGDWVEAGDYGYCWRPNGVDASWQPDTDGYWVFTDAGWTWVSYEDYGSITYHYGRWVSLEDYGWVWKPDYEWGPAWVSWRTSDDYVGWAPLPPEARFNVSVGFGGWVDRDYDIGPSHYSFCEVRNFGAPVLRNVIVERRRNVTIINKTVNITNITINNTKKVVYNGGPDYASISRRSDRPIATLKLQRRTEDRPGRPSRSTRVGNELVVDAPHVEQSQRPAAPPKVARVFKQAKVDKGWNGVSDPALREKIRSENKGHESAKPVDEQRLDAVLPPKADPKGTPGGFRKPEGEPAREKGHNGPAAQPSQNQNNRPQDKVSPTEERRSPEKEQKLQPFIQRPDASNPAQRQAPQKEKDQSRAREQQQNQAERTRKNEAQDLKVQQARQQETQRAQQQQQVERSRQRDEQNNRAARQQDNQRSQERNRQQQQPQQSRQSEVRQSRQAERQDRQRNQQDDSGRKDKKKKDDN